MGDVLEDRKALRAIWAWVLLIGVYAFISGAVMMPVLLGNTTSGMLQYGAGIPLSMIGILLLLRLTSEILEYRSRRSPE